MSAAGEASIQYQLQHIHDNHQTVYSIANAIGVGIAVLSVLLRVVSRNISHNKLQADDLLIFLSLFFMVCYAVCTFLAIHYGMARHSVLITNVKIFSLLIIIGETAYTIVVLTAKLSVIWLYHRIFFSQKLDKILIFLALFATAQGFVGLFSDIFQCTPIKSFWHPEIEGHCINYPLLLIITAVMNIITEVAMLVVPFPLCWRLQMSRSKRIVVIAMFSIGGIVVVVSIVRMFYLHKVTHVDPSWNLIIPVILSNLECGTGILAACLPTLRPIYLYARHGPGLTKSQHDQSTVSFPMGYMGAALPTESRVAQRLTDMSDDERPHMPLFGTQTEIKGASNMKKTEQDKHQWQGKNESQSIVVTQTFTMATDRAV